MESLKITRSVGAYKRGEVSLRDSPDAAALAVLVVEEMQVDGRSVKVKFCTSRSVSTVHRASKEAVDAPSFHSRRVEALLMALRCDFFCFLVI